ncbi:MAG: hypothetical protein WD039_02465 [Xanthobacteraceae bacterium]
MRTSVFLAKLIGPLLAAIGVGMLVNAGLYQRMAAEFLQSYALIYVSGLLALVAGLAIVNSHNVWAADWRIVITILGWLATIGGVCRIVAPQLVTAIGVAIFPHGAALMAAGIAVLAIGGFLSFKGYSQ